MGAFKEVCGWIRRLGEPKRAVSVAAAAEQLGVSKSTVYRKIQRGELPATVERGKGQGGKHCRIPARALSAQRGAVK